MGTDIEALSINANWYGVNRDVAEKMIQLENEKLAELVAQDPQRFGRSLRWLSSFRTWPLTSSKKPSRSTIRWALPSAARVNSDELSNPKFDPFWKKAKERGCLVFTHPQGGKGGRTKVIGNPLETTNFLSHLIFDRTLDRFPGLTICAAHVGGYLLPGASDNGCNRFPEGSKIKKHPTEYSRQIYVDSMYSLLRDCATSWPSAVSVRS
jgi:aminocarboxymuconate-semialdehyde decarboxylase